MILTHATLVTGGFALPVSWTAASDAAAVRTLVPMNKARVAAGAVGTQRRIVDVAPVRLTTATADVFVFEGAFPGTSGWSPPT